MKQSKTMGNYGGRGWFLIIFGGMLFLFGGPFWNGAIPNLTVPIFAEILNVEQAEILHIHTILSWINIFGVLGFGILYEKFGQRRVSTISIFIAAVAAILFGHVTTIVQYAVVRFVVVLLGMSFSSVGVPALYSRYFPTKKGLALGLCTCGASAANIVGVPLLAFMLTKMSLSAALSVFGVVLAILAVVNLIFVPDDPAKVGYLPDNGESIMVQSAVEEETEISAIPAWTKKEALKNRNFWLIAVGYGVLYMCSSGCMTQLVVFETSNGVSQAVATMYVSIMGILGIIGSALSGVFDQKLGTKAAGIIMGGCYALGTFCLGVLPYSFATNLVFIVAFGTMMGAASNLPGSHAISVYGSSSFTGIYAIAFPVISLFGGTATSVLAFSLQLTGSLKGAYAVFMGLAILGTILVGLIKPPVEKKPGEKPVMK